MTISLLSGRRGSSGAEITVNDAVTIKNDVQRTGTRVREQGEWLSRWAPKSELLPRVTKVTSRGYHMETLLIPDLRDRDTLEDCNFILQRLDADLWPRDRPSMLFTFGAETFTHANRRYVKRLCADANAPTYVRRLLLNWLRHIRWHHLEHGLTHGDCIIDNLAYRGYMDNVPKMVLIDPIPATPELPNWRAVDVGRVIQSAIGYEHVRYNFGRLGRTTFAVEHVLNAYMPKDFDVNEAQASLYFAIIHMLRGVRTAPREHHIREGVQQLTNQLVAVTESWMR